MEIYFVRAFVRPKQAGEPNADLVKRLAELEDKTEALAINCDTFSRQRLSDQIGDYSRVGTHNESDLQGI